MKKNFVQKHNYASSQIIEAVEDGKSIDKAFDLAVDLAPEKIKRIKEKVKGREV